MKSVYVLVALLITATVALAQPQTSALINQQLDKPGFTIELNHVLPDAMRIIAQKTGVRIEATPGVWETLPWGDQTNITAKIDNTTLRDALEAITRKLGLTFELKDQAIELQPMPALARLGRRSTQQELQALDTLSSTPANLGTERPTVRQLIEAVDQKLLEMKSPFAIESRPGDNVVMDQPVFVARNATLLDALEALHADTRATWYPWGKSVVIVPKEDQVRNQLSKPLNVRYPGTDIVQVLTELSQKAGVQFEIEPGAIQRIPPESRRIKLELYEASITKALEAIAGVTGLGYVVNEQGVYIWNTANTATGGSRDPIMGMIQLDNGMQILVPASQIPPDMQEYLRTRTKRELDKIRQMMKEEGFKPTPAATQPSHPTTKPNEDL
jgi:hypothetical protein